MYGRAWRPCFLWRSLEVMHIHWGSLKAQLCMEEPGHLATYVWRSLEAQLHINGDASKRRFVWSSLEAQFLWRRLEAKLGMDGEVRKLNCVCMSVRRSMAAKLCMYGDTWKLRFVQRSLEARILMECCGSFLLFLSIFSVRVKQRLVWSR